MKQVSKTPSDPPLSLLNQGAEDYALRLTPPSARRWSPRLLTGTALGGVAFLALEAVGGSLVLNFGFTNAAWAIASFVLVAMATGLPIALYAARTGVDIDLLTRGAGFGYLGSTLTSLIYSAYTILLLALGGAIMAGALHWSLEIPMAPGYLFSSLIGIPFAFWGIAAINKLQKYTQSIWLVLWAAGIGGAAFLAPGSVDAWISHQGLQASDAFDPLVYGTALSICFAFLPQIGQQVAFLRFLPVKQDGAWWRAVALGGPGWALVGGLKLLSGSYLAVLCVGGGIRALADAGEPAAMYGQAFAAFGGPPWLAWLAVLIFIFTCQLKGSTASAYAGSLSWSNFFLRLMHVHPGRGVWLIFNTLFSFALMHFGLHQIITHLFAGYACFAAAWMGAVVADLAILKPLGLSPAYIEYRRGALHDINPVGFGGMALGLVAGLSSLGGAWGPMAQAFAPPLAMGVTGCCVVLLAALTQGRYYLARNSGQNSLSGQGRACGSCMGSHEGRDMLFCPVYNEYICSLCCSLDSVCNKICNPGYFIRYLREYLGSRGMNFVLYSGMATVVMAALFSMCYALIALNTGKVAPEITTGLVLLFVCMLLVCCTLTWWIAQVQENRTSAESGLAHYISELVREVGRRKAVAADLASVSSQQRLILENAGIGIAFVKSGRLVWSNRRFWAFFADGPQGHVGQLWDLFSHAQVNVDSMRQEMRQTLARGLTYVAEVMLYLSGGDVWCTISASAIDPMAVDDGYILLMDDITVRKDAEEQLRQSRENLQRLNDSLEAEVQKRTEELKRNYEAMNQTDKMASLGVLISGMAHEVNNPASFIMLNSGILKGCITDLLDLVDREAASAEQARIGGMSYGYAAKSIPKLLNGIQDGAERIAGIVANLKNYSRPDPVNMSGRVNLNEALDTSLTLLGTFVRDSTDAFVVQKEEGLPLFAGDQRKVEQVIINLVQNACQALTNKGQSVTVSTGHDAFHVWIEVRDAGRGIPESHIKRVMDPFFTTKRECGGTGLGLAVSSSIVNEHGGRMQIDSVLGAGTTVALRFPLPQA